jgi:hypothetical protein
LYSAISPYVPGFQHFELIVELLRLP